MLPRRQWSSNLQEEPVDLRQLTEQSMTLTHVLSLTADGFPYGCWHLPCQRNTVAI